MRPGGRGGFTLVELQIAVVISALIVSAMVGVFLSQTRLSGHQESQRSARAVSRSGGNALLVELRMVEATGGVEAASATGVTLRLPYAVGIVCSTSPTEMIVSLLPVDSVLSALPGYSGYAWRDEAGAYAYVAGYQQSPELGGSAAAVCAGESITTLASGFAVRLTPGVDPVLGAGPGTAVLLYRRARYEFVPATELGGDTALIRTVLDGGDSAILAGPFDGASRFRFFVQGLADPLDEPPADLGTIRGLRLEFQGKGRRPATPGEPPADAPLNTAIFFNNAGD